MATDLIDGKTPLEVLKLQLTHIRQLQKAQPDKPVLVKAIEGKCPEGGDPALYQWIDPVCHNNTLTTYGHPIYTRSILWSEIVIDPDTKDWKAMKEEMDKLIDVLKKYDIPYELYYGGNKSCHLNIFLQISDKDREQIREYSKKYDIDPYKIVRVAMVNELLRLSGSDPVRMGLDWGKITFNRENRGSMVRECGTVRPDGRFKTPIEEIPDSRPVDNPPLVPPKELKQWKFYETPFYKIAVNALKDAVEHAETNNDYNPEHVNFEGLNVLNLPCIKNFARMRLEHNRYYAVEAEALACKDNGTPKEEAKLMLWNLVNTMQGLSESDKELRVNNALELYDTDFHFSCVTVREKFKDYNICDRKNCERHKKIIEVMKVSGSGQSQEPEIEEATEEIKVKAREIAEQGNPLKYIIGVHQTLHIGDIGIAQSLLLSATCQQVLNTEGIQPKLSGASGKGKSDCAKGMAHLIPPEWIITSSLSDKAVYYMEDELRPGTILFCDDVVLSEEMEKVINRATTFYQIGVAHTTVDTNRQRRTLRIPARLAWWLTSIDDDQSLQTLNRTFGGEVDESEEQDKRVATMQREKAKTGEVGLPLNDAVLTCREIIRDIKQTTYIVKIPFADAIIWNDEKNRRNQPIFLDLIKSLAVLRHRQRDIDGDGCLLASYQDFLDAKLLYNSRQEAQTTKLTASERKLCEVLSEAGSLTAKALCSKLGVSKSRLSQILHGKGKNHDSGAFFKIKELWEEDASVKIGDSYVRQKMYGYDGKFNAFDGFESIISYDSQVYPVYPEFTPSLPFENNNGKTKFTLFTLLLKEQSSKDSNLSHNDEDSFSTSKYENQGKQVNSRQPTAKEEGKPEVNQGKQGKQGKQPSKPLVESVTKYCHGWEPIKKTSINSQNYKEVVADYLKGYKLPDNMRGPVEAAVMTYAKIPQPAEVVQ